MFHHQSTFTPPERILARVLRDLLKAERFEDYTSLADALKGRCARLGLFYDGELITRALAIVGSNTPLVHPPPAPLVPSTPPTLPDWPITRRDAAEMLKKWGRR